MREQLVAHGAPSRREMGIGTPERHLSTLDADDLARLAQAGLDESVNLAAQLEGWDTLGEQGRLLYLLNNAHARSQRAAPPMKMDATTEHLCWNGLFSAQRVRKRDSSFGPRSAAGMQAWDTFQMLADTARKLGVNIYHYLRDRICGALDQQRLADRIAEQAGDLALGASWPEHAPHPAWQPVRVQSWQR